MFRLAHSQIHLLVLVPLLLCIAHAEGNKSNRTWLIGLDQNAGNGSGTMVPWFRRVRKQALVGCEDRPWICNEGEEPARVRRRCCNNRCVEVTSDVNNCGVCGIRCPFTWQCCRGVCTDTSMNPSNCGQCFNRCPFFTFCTYGMCGYAGPTPPFPPQPPNPPFPPRPPRPPFPPKPPKPSPFPPKPPKPPRREPEQPEPPQGQPIPKVGQPPLGDGSAPPGFGEPPLFDGLMPPQFGEQPPRKTSLATITLIPTNESKFNLHTDRSSICIQIEDWVQSVYRLNPICVKKRFFILDGQIICLESYFSLHQNLNPNEVNIDEPKDSYHLAYMIHFLLGAGYLVPWNAFITAVDYFQYSYPNKHINKVFSVGYMSASVTVLFTLMCCSSRIKQSSVRVRMNVGQSLFILALMVPPLTDWVDPGVRTDIDFSVLVTMVVVSGLANGLVGGSLVGSTGELPGRYMQAVFAGNATAGLMVSILRILTKASLPHTQKGLRISTRIYFITSVLIVLSCIICTNLLHKLPVIKCYRNRKHIDLALTHHKSLQSSFWVVVKKIRWQVLAVFILYIVSLSIFPGYLSENVESSKFKDWYPIILLTMYDVGDFLGKCLTAIYVPVRSKGAIWCCMVRLVFYPLFIGCIYGPKWMHSEFLVIVLTLILGTSNGYLTSVLMILAPKLVPIDESEVVGIAMETFLVVGLAVGSALGWLWNL
ncbi:equilibrative nucleotide transporter 8-like [Rutidosis leptorrhynchoides]|uniref:equilibrative nucleotide transporter 8-like n=1 Tax=Rutidosis leptorrhynchoides TaxID=125765 RepID=UPI003A99B7B1